MRALDFDVLLLDMSMPGKSGIELIKQVKAEKPKLRVLVLSMHEEHQYAVRAIRAGASGYLTKESASTQLVDGDPQGRAAAARSSAPRSPSSSRWARCRTARDRRTRRCPTASTRCSACWSSGTTRHRHRRAAEPVGQDRQHAQGAADGEARTSATRPSSSTTRSSIASSTAPTRRTEPAGGRAAPTPGFRHSPRPQSGRSR